MSSYPYYRKTRQYAGGAAGLFSFLALSLLWLADAASAGDKKVVGVTLFSFQNPYVVTVGDAMKAEGAKEGVDLVSP
jgi:ABC-type sugar transport system substrate-binding protein